MTPKKIFFLFLLFALSFWLRLSLLSKGAYHLDCLELGLRSEKALNTLQLQFLTGAGYPVPIILGALTQGLARCFSIRDPILAINVLGALFGALCIPANYLAVRKLGDGTIAAFSSVLLSLSPLFLGVTVFGTTHPIALFFFLCGLYFLLRYLETGSLKDLLTAAVLLGLLGGSREQEMILTAPAVALLHFLGTDKGGLPDARQRIRAFLPAVLAASLTAGIFHLPYFLGSDRPAYFGQFSGVLQSGLLQNYPGLLSPLLRRSVMYLQDTFTFFGVMAAVSGMALLLKDRKLRTAAFLLSWFLFPFLFYGNMRTSLPRFFVILLPAVYIAQAIALARLTRAGRLMAFLGLVLLGTNTVLTFRYIHPLLRFRHQHELLIDYVRWISTVTEDNARIIGIDINPFIRYYAGRQPLERPADLHKADPEALSRFSKELDQLLAQKVPVYITAPGMLNYNQGHKFSDMINDRYRLEYIGGRTVEEWYTAPLYPEFNFYWLKRVLPRSGPGP